MITRREAVQILGSASAGACLVAAHLGLNLTLATDALAANPHSTPPLAPGDPLSAKRIALIEAFKKKSEGLEQKFEARTHKGDWEMPYRLFRPATTRKAPLVLYLHGSGGLGDDNLKQLGRGNIFGTRVWLLPENQRRFPCYVIAPQTDRGWIRYDLSEQTEGLPEMLPGLGDGARMALEIVDALRLEFPVDERGIFVTGQSMGGAGVWNVITNRPDLFAAAVICCGSDSSDDPARSIATPLWNFHGAADHTVPVSLSRNRIAARRKAGGRPLYTEYAGVEHNVWEWAFTEPAIVEWMFSQRRGRRWFFSQKRNDTGSF